MNRFFRSALFPLIIIAALVWLALQTLGSHGPKQEKQTFSQLYQTALNQPATLDEVTFDPTKQQIEATLQNGKKVVVHYASNEDEHAFQQQLQQAIASGAAPTSPTTRRASARRRGGGSSRARSRSSC